MKIYSERERDESERVEFDPEAFDWKCPVCGKGEIEFFSPICPVCKWQYDQIDMFYPDVESCPNAGESLNSAREKYRTGEKTKF